MAMAAIAEWPRLTGQQAFGGIIGQSVALDRVLSQVQTVAPTGATVLIHGETGTGKEMIARSIHDGSTRASKPFIKLNCAAIPLGLLESELFGHERGSFTGAIAQRIGRFEAANKGTLFLDEIGDIPLELQAKLLRVIQEQEFERLGSTRTLKVDVRLVAATHRNLSQMVEKGEFRSDLYYRLRVFPITIPPLRERREDIPELVRHFVAEYSDRMNRKVDVISAETMEAFKEYTWPGNIRELQNFVERSVVLSTDRVLRAPIVELREATRVAQESTDATRRLTRLQQVERDQILRTLDECDWVLGGKSGAASRLRIPRTTLIYKMRRLGIERMEPAVMPEGVTAFAPVR